MMINRLINSAKFDRIRGLTRDKSKFPDPDVLPPPLREEDKGERERERV